MDTIQKILIKAGRKDLAQEYYRKVVNADFKKSSGKYTIKLGHKDLAQEYYRKVAGAKLKKDVDDIEEKDLPKASKEQLGTWYGYFLHFSEPAFKDPKSLKLMEAIEKEVKRRGLKLKYDRSMNLWRVK